MKIRNEQEKKMLRDAIKRCSGYVALVSSTSGREYDLKNDEMQAEALPDWLWIPRNQWNCLWQNGKM